MCGQEEGYVQVVMSNNIVTSSGNVSREIEVGILVPAIVLMSLIHDANCGSDGR